MSDESFAVMLLAAAIAAIFVLGAALVLYARRQ